MKFSTIVLALATVVAPSAAEYVCHIEAIFTYASDDTPFISNEAQEFLGSVMVDTFNEAYAIEVINDNATATRELGNTQGARQLWTNTRPGGNHCGPTCSNDDDSRMLTSSEVVPAGVRMLWTNTHTHLCGPTCNDSRMFTSSEVVPVGYRMLYWTNTRPGGNICGPTCSNDDDSRMLTSSEVVPGDRKLWTNALYGSGSFTDEFGDALKHAAWEKLFLEKGRTHTQLTVLKGAIIVLWDCHIE